MANKPKHLAQVLGLAAQAAATIAFLHVLSGCMVFTVPTGFAGPTGSMTYAKAIFKEGTSEPTYVSYDYKSAPSPQPGLLGLNRLSDDGAYSGGVIRVLSVNGIVLKDTKEIVRWPKPTHLVIWWIDLYPEHLSLELELIERFDSPVSHQVQLDFNATAGHDYIPMGTLREKQMWFWLVECPKFSEPPMNEFPLDCDGGVGVVVAGEKPP